MSLEKLRAKPASHVTAADRAALHAAGFAPPSPLGVTESLFSRLCGARTEWQAALVFARRSRGGEVRALQRLRVAERDYCAAHLAVLRWSPRPDPLPPKFRRMPAIDPYAVPARGA